jgi:hypothetical protein
MLSEAEHLRRPRAQSHAAAPMIPELSTWIHKILGCAQDDMICARIPE